VYEAAQAGKTKVSATLSSWETLQGIVAGSFLLAASTLKLVAPADEISQLSFARLTRRVHPAVGARTLVRTWRILGVAELLLATALFAAIRERVVGTTAVAFFAAGLFYLAWTVKQSGGSTGCGCLSTSADTGYHAIGRAAVLEAGLVGYTIAGRSPWSGFTNGGLTVVALMVGEVGLLLWLTDELHPLLRSVARDVKYAIVRRATSAAELERAVREIEGTPYWLSLVSSQELTGIQHVASWMQKGWTLSEYVAEMHGRQVTLVGGAVSRLKPAYVRILILEDRAVERPELLASWDSTVGMPATHRGSRPPLQPA